MSGLSDFHFKIVQDTIRELDYTQAEIIKAMCILHQDEIRFQLEAKQEKIYITKVQDNVEKNYKNRWDCASMHG